MLGIFTGMYCTVYVRSNTDMLLKYHVVLKKVLQVPHTKRELQTVFKTAKIREGQ